MSVVCRRQAGADIEELADARFLSKKAHGPAKEGEVGLYLGADRGPDLDDLLCGRSVSSVVVLAA